MRAVPQDTHPSSLSPAGPIFSELEPTPEYCVVAFYGTWVWRFQPCTCRVPRAAAAIERIIPSFCVDCPLGGCWARGFWPLAAVTDWLPGLPAAMPKQPNRCHHTWSGLGSWTWRRGPCANCKWLADEGRLDPKTERAYHKARPCLWEEPGRDDPPVSSSLRSAAAPPSPGSATSDVAPCYRKPLQWEWFITD